MIKIVILAAGKGTRMGSELPKTLVEIHKRPMIKYLLDSIMQTKIDINPIIVVSPDNHQQIKHALNEYNCLFAIQDKPLGTGHALAAALEIIPDSVKKVICLYGDHPFISSSSLKKLHTNSLQSIISILSVRLPDFNDWRSCFLHWGRLLRNNNAISEIIEFKDATDDLKQITEVNPGIYCFEADWLKQNINFLTNNNNQQEYYLTDLIKLAQSQSIFISDSEIKPEEAIGINSPEELKIAETLHKK